MSQIYTVRASSWGRLFDCPHGWEGTHLLGIRSPGGVRALLGTAIHAGTALFDQGRISGEVITADEAAGHFVEQLRHPEFEVDYSDDISVDEAERLGIPLLVRYCLDVSPRYDFKAIELETKPLDIDCGNGITVRLTGTLDRSRVRVDHGGGTGITDLKSGARAVEKGAAKVRGHHPQIGTYELLYEHTTGEAITAPGEIIGLKTGGKPEIATGDVCGAKAMMVGTPDEPGLLGFASEMFRAGLFPPNPQSIICTPKYCARWATCNFHY